MKNVILLDIIEKASTGAYGEESEYIGKLAGALMAAKFDMSWGPFICGAHGEQDVNGMHESYAICPCYGADVQCTVMYTKKPYNEEGLSKYIEDTKGER